MSTFKAIQVATTGTVFAGAMFIGSVLAIGCSTPEYPTCENDEQCHTSEHCVNGQCQQCRDDSDCPAGQSCASGRCEPIPGWCGSDADCPAGQQCIDNRCVAPAVVETPMEAPAQCTLQSVNFAYDEDEISSSAGATLQADAECIQQRNIPHVTVVGHCDPRGTEEYNLALGHRRAQRVQAYLSRLGVQRSHVGTQSMGEEMAHGSNESGWARDRRADIEER